MNELQKAKLDVEADIAKLEAQDDTAVIEDLVATYRAEIEAQYASEKAAQIAELNAGLKYIRRAIDRAEAEAALPEAEAKLAEAVESEAVETAVVDTPADSLA